MTGPVDRDRQVEHLLRQSLPPGAPASSPCVDAEQLAAWSAGTLRREDAVTVERHLADCAHCQAMLAAFVDSEPMTTGAVSFWQRWSMRWLVPVTAASAVVFVWVLVTREPIDPPDASTTMARGEDAQPIPLPSTVVPGELRQAVPAAPPAPPLSKSESAAVALSDVPAREPVLVGGTSAPSSQMAADARSDALAGPGAQSASAARPAERSVAATPPPAAAAPPPPPSAPPAAMEFDAATKSAAATFGAVRGQTPVPAGMRAEAVPAEPAPTRVIRSAVGAESRMWRIDPDGRVSRSFGAFGDSPTWVGVSIEPAAFITAGSATGSVCWLVGRAGVVLRSIDGVTFERRAFPEAVALTGVQAQDASRATVTTIDGRAFTTTDAGGSWLLRP